MSRAALAAAFVVVVASCAAPARRLSPRIVEDPIVLPRRMASVTISPWRSWYRPPGARAGDFELGVRIGLTDRLELADLTSLRYAILDDAPGSPLPRSRLSLAVQAGALGVGYSSEEHWLVWPLLAVQAQKHVGDRWRLGAGAYWQGFWVQKPITGVPHYDAALYTSARRRSAVGFGVSATRQLAERWALAAGLSASQNDDCLSPFCAWRTRTLRSSASLSFRPWHWLTLGAGADGGLRYRPRTLLAPEDPTMPIAPPPRQLTWVGVHGFVSFYW